MEFLWRNTTFRRCFAFSTCFVRPRNGFLRPWQRHRVITRMHLVLLCFLVSRTLHRLQMILEQIGPYRAMSNIKGYLCNSQASLGRPAPGSKPEEAWNLESWHEGAKPFQKRHTANTLINISPIEIQEIFWFSSEHRVYGLIIGLPSSLPLVTRKLIKKTSLGDAFNSRQPSAQKSNSYLIVDIFDLQGVICI